MAENESEKHSIVEMDQLRVLLRTLDHRFGSEALYREIRGILAESAAGRHLLAEADPVGTRHDGGAEGREDTPAPGTQRQRSQDAWENAVNAASQPVRTSNTRDTQSQGKLAAARRALGGS